MSTSLKERSKWETNVRPGDNFSDSLQRALQNSALQDRLRTITGYLRTAQSQAMPPRTPTDDVRERAKLIRAEVIAHLDDYLEEFGKKATERGIQVHVARKASDARRIVLDIAQKNGIRRVAKGKSMVSEEVELREALDHQGIAEHRASGSRCMFRSSAGRDKWESWPAPMNNIWYSSITGGPNS